MTHVLIIDDNVLVGRAVEEVLSERGMTSFSHAWTERQALFSAEDHRPDLIVIGDGLEEGSRIKAAETISRHYGVPALLVTANSLRVTDSLPEGCSVAGPYLVRDLDLALADLGLSEKPASLSCGGEVGAPHLPHP